MAAFVIGINENEFVHVVDAYQGVISEIRYGAPIEEATVYSDYSTANNALKSVKENADSIRANSYYPSYIPQTRFESVKECVNKLHILRLYAEPLCFYEGEDYEE